MKSLSLVIGMMLGFAGLNAQTLDNTGLYMDDTTGELFNGTVSKTQDGIKSDYTVKNGVINGQTNYYYASGKLMESGMYTKGQKDQKWTRYSETGNISAVAFYNLGKKTGTWLVYDENNKKRFEMNYDNGEKTGVWTNWDENGMVMNTKTYGHSN